METLRYPIGRFTPPDPITDDDVAAWIDMIAALPGDLRRAVENLSDAQLDTRYRPDGWMVRQVVHHVVDSHLNAYVRFKWTLTEDTPVIKAYDEKAWAELPDTHRTPVAVSLALLDALHARWTVLMRSLTGDERARIYIHPVSGPVRLSHVIGMYAWHGRHHLAHIAQAVGNAG